MKIYNSLLTLCLLMILTSLSAQQRSKVMANQLAYEDKTIPGQEITINASMDEVEDSWDEYWDEKYKVDIDKADKGRNTITFLAEAVSLPTVSTKTMDIHSKLSGSDRITKVSLAISFGYDMHATADKYPEVYLRATKILEDFQTYFYRNYYDKKIAVVRKDLEDVRDDRMDAEEDQSKAAKKIRKYQDKIKKLEERIADERKDMSEEEITEADKLQRVLELERKLSALEYERRNYLL